MPGPPQSPELLMLDKQFNKIDRSTLLYKYHLFLQITLRNNLTYCSLFPVNMRVFISGTYGFFFLSRIIRVEESVV